MVLTWRLSLLVNCNDKSFIKALNESQYNAVMQKGKPLLILAGAGSGKTRVITTKIAYLVSCLGVDPRSILAVTFTNKAAGEMRERVLQMVPGSDGVMIRTFHSFGAWLLRRNSGYLGLQPRFSIYDDDDSLSLLQSVYSNYKRKDLKPYAKWISRAKDYCLSPDEDLSSISFDHKLSEVYKAYEKKIRKVGSVDFGDLILRSVELLRDNDQIRDRIQNRFQVILVDEYQDSNIAQYELLKLLYNGKNYICVVGDDDQSIYSFRGAEVKNIITFPKSFPGAEVIKLEQNYRSTGNILGIASKVVSSNRGRIGKKLWTDKEDGAKGVVKIVENQQREAQYCASLLKDGNLDGTAILYRTNAQSLSFESYFLNHKIPYKIVGSLKFYDREEIKDVTALFSLFLNPFDEIAFRRIINKPSKGIGKVSLNKIIDRSINDSCSLIEGCKRVLNQLSSKGAEGLEKFVILFEKLDNISEKINLGEFTNTAIHDSGILEYHRAQDEISLTQKVKNLEEMVNAAAQYPKGKDGLLAFLEDMELDRSRLAGIDPASQRGVTLITMHNTKGLEFDRVIIVGMEEGLFPSRPDESDDDLEEERRIFYVSITRAKKEIYFTACRQRRIWGKLNFQTPSRFLNDIPDDFVVGSGESILSGYKKNEFSVGTFVYHDDYGTGQVVKEWDNGNEVLIIVRFESGRTAQFIPKYAGLVKIAGDNDF
ncbi:MAG: UvrD-helicase domain-containing protein [Spirochaetaceae bacterium]|nr:UvrD-helicase domain-containing protein [Spirochaetaceae bacterium]